MRFKAPPTVALDPQFLREQFRAHPLPLPALPAGYARDVQAFGREIGWGSTQAESLNNMTRIDVRRLRALGLDAGMARQLRDYCLAEDQRDRQIRAAETPQHWGTTFRMLEERQRAQQAEDARVVRVGGRPAFRTSRVSAGSCISSWGSISARRWSETLVLRRPGLRPVGRLRLCPGVVK